MMKDEHSPGRYNNKFMFEKKLKEQKVHVLGGWAKEGFFKTRLELS